jgi:hypothetical protein
MTIRMLKVKSNESIAEEAEAFIEHVGAEYVVSITELVAPRASCRDGITSAGSAPIARSSGLQGHREAP